MTLSDLLLTARTGNGGGGGGAGDVDWDEKLRKHRERMKRLGIGSSASTGNLSSQSAARPPPDVVLSTRTSNVMVCYKLITSDSSPVIMYYLSTSCSLFSSYFTERIEKVG